MPTIALLSGGQEIDAQAVPPSQWEAIQLASTPGVYKMACCGANAALKTSPNGLQFFAHFGGQCGTAPETAWHLQSKAAVLAALRTLGLEGRAEVSGNSKAARWEADVLFKAGARRVAIELQRSPQTLKQFLRRQARYEEGGVECYWLVPRSVFLPVLKAGAKLKWTREWNRVIPERGAGFLPDLPLALLTHEREAPMVATGGGECSLLEWLLAVAARQFVYARERWSVRA
jgi:competence protein CoiA